MALAENSSEQAQILRFVFALPFVDDRLSLCRNQIALKARVPGQSRQPYIEKVRQFRVMHIIVVGWLGNHKVYRAVGQSVERKKTAARPSDELSRCTLISNPTPTPPAPGSETPRRAAGSPDRGASNRARVPCRLRASRSASQSLQSDGGDLALAPPHSRVRNPS